MKRTIVKLKKGDPLIVKGKATVRVVGKPRPPKLTTQPLRKPRGLPTRRIAKDDLPSYASEVFSRLKTAHPDAHVELDYETPLQLLIATILSAQCTDKRVNMVTPMVL